MPAKTNRFYYHWERHTHMDERASAAGVLMLLVGVLVLVAALGVFMMTIA
jgi:hypothetical protein